MTTPTTTQTHSCSDLSNGKKTTEIMNGSGSLTIGWSDVQLFEHIQARNEKYEKKRKPKKDE